MRPSAGRRLLHASKATLSPVSTSITGDDSAPPVVVCIVGGRAYPPAETNTPRRAQAPRTSRPSLRISRRDLLAIVQRLPSRLMRATPAFTIIALSSVFVNCAVLVAARAWRPRWRARSRTVSAHHVHSDVATEPIEEFIVSHRNLCYHEGDVGQCIKVRTARAWPQGQSIAVSLYCSLVTHSHRRLSTVRCCQIKP